uniref:Uncharacterized protein n=1 Tax=Amphimedon queenslandica TaxID=400682 RepID=A0A1X7VHP2_AMPQE
DMSEGAPDSLPDNDDNSLGESLVQEHIIPRGLTVEDLRQHQPSNDVLVKP